MSKNKQNALSWESFQELGDPNADIPNLNEKEKVTNSGPYLKDKIRVYLEKKGRSGKTVSLIKGLSLSVEELEKLCKSLKSSCGVGGKTEGTEIMIQGDQRKKIMEFFKRLGYKDIIDAGS